MLQSLAFLQSLYLLTIAKFPINDWCSLLELSLKSVLKTIDVYSVVSSHVETVVLLSKVQN